MDGDVSGLVRDEEEQATEVGELLDLYAAEGVAGAFVFNFIEPANTYSTNPAEDFDKAGFAIVKCYGPDGERPYAGTGYFEPKRSFEAVQPRYAPAAAARSSAFRGTSGTRQVSQLPQ